MPLQETTLAPLDAFSRQSLGLRFVAWIAMIIPVAAPVTAGSLLVSNWPQYAARTHPKLIALQMCAACFVLLTAGLQFALQYCVRSSDWAATPEASLRYRTYLGLNLGLVSLWQGHLLGPPLLRRLDRGDVLILGIPVLIVTLGLLSWVRYQLQERSDSPKPDPRTNFFYYNPGNPAWVVPGRSGSGFNLNHARPPVWVLDVLFAGILVGLLNVVRLALR